MAIWGVVPAVDVDCFTIDKNSSPTREDHSDKLLTLSNTKGKHENFTINYTKSDLLAGFFTERANSSGYID
jgi:hypothetical protein